MRGALLSLLALALVATAPTTTIEPSAPVPTTLGEAPHRGDHPTGDDGAGRAAQGEPDSRVTTPHDHQNPDKRENDCEGCSDYEKQSLAINRGLLIATKSYVCWTALLVLVGVLVGFGQLYLTRGSLRVSRDAARAAREAVTNLERARLVAEWAGDPQQIISPHEVTMGDLIPKPKRRLAKIVRDVFRSPEAQKGPLPVPGDDPEGRILYILEYKLANLGRSPARIIAIGADCKFTTLPCPVDRPYPELRQVRENPLGPKTRRTETVLADVTRQQREAMSRQQGALMVWGLVQYRDIFNQLRETGFCWLVERPTMYLTEKGTSWDESLWIVLDGPSEYFRQT